VRFIAQNKWREAMFEKIEKRDGRKVKFEAEKINIAIVKAGAATGEFDKNAAQKLTLKVLSLASSLIGTRIPTVEEIQDIVEEVLLSSPYRKTARAYIIYREQHARLRAITTAAHLDLVDQYLGKNDWRINENSNMTFSLQGLNNYLSSEVTGVYWLNKIYPAEIREAHLNGDFHIHDLSIFSTYCVGWDLFDLLAGGFGGVSGKVESKPAKHLRSALGQIANFFYTLQGESAGAQAFSFDSQTPITIKRNGHIETVTLEMLFNDYKHNARELNRSEVIFTEDVYRRYSIDDANKRKYLDSRMLTEPILFQLDKIEVLTENGFVPLNAISRHKIKSQDDELLIIETEDGNVLRVTRSHPVVLADRTIKRADELKKGEELLSFNPNLELTEKIELQNDFAYLIGFMIAEGCWGHQTRDYSIVSQKRNTKERKKIENILKKLKIPYFENGEFNIVFGTTSMGRFIRNHLNLQSGSDRKNLPQFLFSLKKKNIGDLISGLIDGDGDIDRERIIRIHSTGYSLLMQLKQVLKILGINSTVRYVFEKNAKENYKDAYVIRFRIPGELLPLFDQSIKLQNIRFKIKESPKFSSRVVKITDAKYDNEYVYDITSKNNHFLINNIVVHNSNFDTLLSPFIRYDNLSFQQVRQAIQEFIFNVNVPTRVGFQCISEDTEILTPEGWQGYNEIREGSIIKTFNIKTKRIENQRVTNVFKRYYKGIMYNLKNRIQDQLVSPKHKVVRKKFQTDEYILESIEEIMKLKSPFIIPIVAGKNLDKIQETYIQKVKKVNYQGVIWSPHTKNETVVARRKGKVFITGNTPFTNITIDLTPPPYFAKQPVIIGGKPRKETYREFQEEMDIINRAFLEVMAEGDGKGRVFSVDADCLCPIKNSGKIKLIKIGEYTDNLMEKRKPFYFKENNCQVLDARDLNLQCLGLKEGKIDWQKINFLVRHSINNLLRISTVGGFNIKVTPSHSVLVLKDGEIQSFKASNLKAGDYLVAPKIIPSGENKIAKISLAEEFLKRGKTDGIYIREAYKENGKRLWQKRTGKNSTGHVKVFPLNWIGDKIEKFNLSKAKISLTGSKIKISNELPITKELAEFLGWYCAEGSAEKNKKYGGISLAFNLKEEKRTASYLAHLIKKIWLEIPIRLREIKERNLIEIRIHSKLLRRIITEIFRIENGVGKKVPQIIFELSPEMKRIFLSAYFKGDAWITQNTVVNSISRELIYGVSTLLKQLGIFHTLTEYKWEGKTRWRINIWRDNELEKKDSYTISKIPLQESGLEKIVERILEKEPDFYDSLGRKYRNFKTRIFQKFGISHQSSTSLKRMKEGVSYAVKLGIEIPTALKEIENDNLLFLKIKKIEKTKSSNGMVYDFSTESENFVADQFLVHNTFPIPTYNITKNFDWENSNAKLLWEVTAKYGIPYFCLDENTEIFTDKGVKKIKNVSLKDKVLSNTGKLEKISFKKKVKSNESIILEGDEFSIICSLNHRFLTKDGLKMAQDLSLDDYLLQYKDEVVFENGLVLNNYYQQFFKVDDLARLGRNKFEKLVPKRIIKKIPKFQYYKNRFQSTLNEKVKIPDDLNEDLMELMGIILGDGSIRKSTVKVTNADEEIIDFTVETIKNNFGLKPEIRKAGKSEICKEISVSSVILVSFLRSINLGGNTYTKRIPEICFWRKEKEISALLRGLFDTDGSLTLNRGKNHIVSISFANNDLMNDVLILLAKIGIIGKINKLGKKGFRLVITGERNIRLFREKVGFRIKRKERLLSYPCKDSKHPSMGDKIVSIEEAKKISKFYAYKGKDLVRVKSKNEYPYLFISSHQKETKAVSINKIERIKEERILYDLTVVSKNHLFVLRNGIISHNSNFINSDMNPEDARSMCPLAGEEKVLIKSSRGRRVEYSSIRNIYEGNSKQEEYEIYSDGKFIKGRFNKFNNQRMIKIVLENGHEIKTSEQHLNFVMTKPKSKELILKGKELKIGMYLPYSLNIYKGEGGNKDLGYFVGCYAGDGSLDGDTAVAFSLENYYKKEVIVKLKKISKDYFGTSGVVKADKKSKLVTLKICSRTAVGLCKDFVENKERNKRYAPKLFTMGEEFRRAVLSGHYATDGGNRNRIYTSSPKMVQSLNILAATLGTTTSIYKDERKNRLGKEPNYAVLIYQLNRKNYGSIWFKKGKRLWMKIKKIKPIQNSAAYCFEANMGTNPIFTVGTSGILTHNCRLRLDNRVLRKRGGGLFGAAPLTGSVGVVTINMARLGYLASGKKDFREKLNRLMELAKNSLEIKRKTLERFTENNLYPYSKYYLRAGKERFGEYWKNHFSTIGLLGMNEACLNLLGKDIGDEKSREFTLEILDFMRKKLLIFQGETGNIYNLEATPAEGTSYRLAKTDKEKFPEIICANEESFRNEGTEPFYTNSTQLPVDYTDDILEVLDLQDDLQTKYTGGTVIHFYLGEKIDDPKMIQHIVQKICKNYRLPYFTITPTFSICSVCGYIPGEHFTCPKCSRETEVYSRVVGYLRPVKQWNKGKKAEFSRRKTFKVE